MRRSLWVLVALIVMGLWMASRATAQDENPLASLQFLVLKDYNGKPVKNASVVLHPVNKKGKQERGGLQLKTNAEGKTNFDGIPYGILRVQVLVPGFQTFGEDYDINKPEMAITIKLQRPQGQYSIYEEHPEDKKKEDQKPPDEKPAQKPEQKAPEQKPQ